jgi:hypothetical protein
MARDGKTLTGVVFPQAGPLPDIILVKLKSDQR